MSPRRHADAHFHHPSCLKPVAVRVVNPENHLGAPASREVPDMFAAALVLLLTPGLDDTPKATPPTSPKEALQPLGVLIGSWKGSGAPEGTREERAAGAWSETASWEWKFKNQDAWLAVTFE